MVGQQERVLLCVIMTQDTSGDIPVTLDEITPAWLSATLGVEVTDARSEPIGTGQMALCYRLYLTGADELPDTIVVKLPNPDPAMRELVAGVYRNESTFYRDIASTVDVRTPACYSVDFRDDGRFYLLLEDMSRATQGDQIGGCTPEELYGVVRNLAGLHGPRWCDRSLVDIPGMVLNGPDDVEIMREFVPPSVEQFIEAEGERVPEEDHALLREMAPLFRDWLLARQDERFALNHGDFRLDNLLFDPALEHGSVAVDFQTLSVALPGRDLAYTIGTSLSPEDRRAHERELVSAYHEALGPEVTADFSLEQCWDDYVFGMPQILLTSVLGQVYGDKTERGAEMFAAMVRRGCTAIRDLGTMERISA